MTAARAAADVEGAARAALDAVEHAVERDLVTPGARQALARRLDGAARVLDRAVDRLLDGE